MSEWQRQSEQPSSSKKLQPVLEEAQKVNKDMNQDIQELRNFRSQANQFYDNKIKEVQALGTKINKYGPGEQLSQITSKLNLSSQTCGLLKRVVNKQTN